MGKGHASRILVVEDDLRLLPVLQEVLEAEGYEIAIARHGRAAIDAFQTSEPDLVLLDMEMPGMDGFEFMKWLGQRAIRPPVIIASCDDDVDAVRVGAVAKLSKPYDLDRLLETVSGILALTSRES